MRRIEVRICKKCGKTYMRESGGIVSTPADYLDDGMCRSCQLLLTGKTITRIIDIFKGKDKNG